MRNIFSGEQSSRPEETIYRPISGETEFPIVLQQPELQIPLSASLKRYRAERGGSRHFPAPTSSRSFFLIRRKVELQAG